MNKAEKCQAVSQWINDNYYKNFLYVPCDIRSFITQKVGHRLG